jgi:MerR family transcriptional regulator, light-induced transcriptional regulator
VTSQTPIFNMSAVLRETGLNADVLRAWERRYNLPAPQRTPGGHRLYSEQDIETVKWLKARQAEGMSISRAVELWKETLASPQAQPALLTAPAAQPVEGQIDALGRRWMEACLAFDERTAEDALNQAFAMVSVETVCRDVLQRKLGEIGQAWYTGHASVQQEHFASALAIRRIEALITATPQSYRQQSVLIGCPPGERHVLPALLLNLYLRRKGWRMVYLGADLPAEHLVDTAAGIRPDLVILTAQQLDTAATLRTMALIYEQTRRTLAYGGLIFNRVPALPRHIPGHFLRETLEAGVAEAERLLLYPAPSSSVSLLATSQTSLARAYRETRILIEHDLFQVLETSGVSIQGIEQANLHFGNSLSAALEFGSLEFLDADLAWLIQRPGDPRAARRTLRAYLAAYDQALRARLGSRADPISTWISAQIGKEDPFSPSHPSAGGNHGKA